MNWVEKLGKYTDGIKILSEWLGAGGHIVERGLAQQRTDICLGCAFNQKSNMVTASVSQAIRKHLALKNHLQIRVAGEKSLHQCQICLCEMRLKVHVPIEFVQKTITEEERQKFPDYCWQKTETKI